MSRRAMIIYSGGMDSFTLLRHLLTTDWEVRALSFVYAQRHVREISIAKEVCEQLEVPHTLVDITDCFSPLARSALTNEAVDVPEGHYAADNMKLTVVPGRNAVMLATAASYAEVWAREDEGRGQVELHYAAHAGDHTIYPDCRPEFVQFMTSAILASSDGRVRLRGLFLNETKGSILRIGARAGLTAADYKQTHSCYAGTAIPCGKCGSCTERAEAFAEMGWTDPLVA